MSCLLLDYERHLRAAGRSPHTIRAWVGVLRRVHHDLPHGLAYAETSQLEAWLAAAARTAPAVWSAVSYGRAIRRFYSWADGRYLAGDPAALMARTRQPGDAPNPVTDEELRLALALCSSWWRVAVLLGTLAGLRASETAALRRADITPDWIRIRRAKGGDPATVPTHPQLLELARCHHHEWMMPPTRRPPPIHDLSSRAGRYFAEIGLPGVTLHRFRHRFATDLMRANVPLSVIQKLMRHKSIRSTQAYTLVLDTDTSAAVAQLPWAA